MKSNIGITQENLAKVAHSLNVLLADETILYIKTRNAHWNVEDPNFHALHLFLEEQYGILAQIIDDIAERIRSLGHYAEATLKGYLELTHLTEKKSKKNDGPGYLKELLDDHEAIIKELRGNIPVYDEDWNDVGSSDFITGILQTHEKIAWMLRSHLK
ncbi:Dps family protein [Albibacterium bauzanense]|nr:DNA starvation/stationary phase protection protein [Albibacterium bauzanense]